MQKNVVLFLMFAFLLFSVANTASAVTIANENFKVELRAGVIIPRLWETRISQNFLVDLEVRVEIRQFSKHFLYPVPKPRFKLRLISMKSILGIMKDFAYI